MCGRFLLSVDIEELLERYRIAKGWVRDSWEPEIFPSHTVPVVMERSSRELAPLKWGFVPPYAKGLIINARSETVDAKPMFKRPFRQKRCIIPADAFFEWKREGKKSTKYRISRRDHGVFSMAAIYDDFVDQSGNPFTAFSILTTRPNPLIAQIHDRMPVILPVEAEGVWLDPKLQDPALLKDLLRPFDEEGQQLQMLLEA